MEHNNINNNAWYDLKREEIISLPGITVLYLGHLENVSKCLVCKAIGCKQNVTPQVVILGKAQLFQSASLQNARDNHAPLGPF